MISLAGALLRLFGEVKVSRLRVCLRGEPVYSAWIVSVVGRYFYCARGRMTRISEQQFHAVISNPHLYCFSTALKLHRLLDLPDPHRISFQ